MRRRCYFYPLCYNIVVLFSAPIKDDLQHFVFQQTSTLIDEIKKFKVIEDGIEFDQKRLKAIKMDVSNTDAIRKLKGHCLKIGLYW